jgi:hypothetical protein
MCEFEPNRGQGFCPESHVPIYPVGNASNSLWDNVARSMGPNTHLQVVPRSRKLKSIRNKTPWALVRERTIPTDRPPLVEEILVPTFVDRGMLRGQRGGSSTVVNLSFLDQSRYFYVDLYELPNIFSFTSAYFSTEKCALF